MFKLKIVSPQGVYNNYDIDSLLVRAHDGDLTILSNHAPLVVKTKVCHLLLKKGNKSDEYAIGEGILQFSDNECSFLVEAIESKDEIDIERAKAAKQRAEKQLKETGSDFLRAQAALSRAINRLGMFD
ncbi:MAG: ATP synthase F1 subunit epsilon [Erysipelotrichaceae bacterium]